MIVSNDESIFTRILSILNHQNALKFLYDDANSERRALMKRAAPSGIVLAKKFRVEEMPSTSTFEFAFENRS